MESFVGSLLSEFHLLASGASSLKEVATKKKKRSRRALSRGHSKNVAKKRKSRQFLAQELRHSIHARKRTPHTPDNRISYPISDKQVRIREILSELANISLPAIIGLLEKYPRREFTKEIAFSISNVLINSKTNGLGNLRLEILRLLGIAITKASSLHLVHQCMAILLKTSENSLSIIRGLILKVAQRIQRVILDEIANFAKNCQDSVWLTNAFEIGKIVFIAENKPKTKLSALRLISHSNFGESSLEVIISELRSLKPIVRRCSVDTMCHPRRSHRAIPMLLKEFKRETVKSNSRILIKALARIGVRILPSEHKKDITRISASVSSSPLFEILVARSLEIPNVCNNYLEARALTASIFEIATSLKPVGRLGIISALSHGRIHF